MNFTAIYTTTTKFISRNLPKILGVAAIGFGVAAIATTPAATKKVDKHLTEFENRVDEEGNKVEVSTKEYVCTIAADIAIPVALTLAACGCGVGCILSYDSKVKRLASTVTGLSAEVYGLRKAVDEKYGEGAAEKLYQRDSVDIEKETDKNGKVKGVKVKETEKDIRNLMDKHHGFWVCDTKYYMFGNVTGTKEVMNGLNVKLCNHIAKLPPETVISEWEILKHFGVHKKRLSNEYIAASKTLGIKAKDWPAGGVSFIAMPTPDTDDDGGLIYEIRGTFPRFTEVIA